MPPKDWSDMYQAQGNEAIREHFRGKYHEPDNPCGTYGTDGTTSDDQAPPGSVCHQEDGTSGTPERPYFSVHEEPFQCDGKALGAGVWFHDIKRGQPVDQWVCSPLYVEAITSCEGADFGRLVYFRNSLGQWQQWSMPMSLMAGSGEILRAELLSLGLEISPVSHGLLNQYLQKHKPKRKVVAATSTGWNSPSLFVMPRRNIGSGDVIYQSETANADDYCKSGTLKKWKAEIGNFCLGNPILMLSIGAALAGPLLHHLNRQGGGFHLKGDSSTGKTTGLIAAASVWGKPERFVRTWCATANGLEGVASQRNDTLLALDEIGEALPKELGNIVYSLANGVGKARATKAGMARATRQWRIMILSSGETSLNSQMQAFGRQTRAGQEIRLLDTSAHRTFGAWDDLHGREDGKSFSNAIQKSASNHYGHAGPRFVEQLIDSGKIDQLPEMLANLTNQFQAFSGQEERAAERFAIVALAGELAASFGIFDMPEGEPTKNMVQLFNRWRQERGKGQSEGNRILQSLSDFLTRHGDSLFSDIADSNTHVRDRAGWWKETALGRIWLFTSEGLRRAVPGYEIGRITQALEQAGWLAERGGRERAKRVKVNNRPLWLYHVREPDS
ncbi:DUF927 domain-containing protein [Larsenimonas suaedae]|uniref:DUF927 domain-containing protein n=1 Tax=Larsenimonas suaedae TaxID=1851019 RepID=A0ABU1H014_9GAMM|nr:DUF927 domain-containing protein [Larsenimonas suaedae]MCM2972898.1 DUF927 domain-containing protein [Larsenimonas suaedae]MDR5896997.1 DUF927 domain-containing protein [Larsenimonas suaedae]